MYVLTWIYGNKVTEIFKHPDVRIVQSKRSILKKEANYKRGKFQVRTEEGLKHVKILVK